MAKTRRHLRIQNQLLNTDNDHLIMVAPVPASLATLCQTVTGTETTDITQGPDVDVEGGVWIRFGSTNTASTYGYFSGVATVPSTARFELGVGQMIWENVSNMSELYFTSSSTDWTFYLAQG